MSFGDRQLQKCYDRNFAESADSSVELRPIGALIAAQGLFRQLEGPHSPRVHEAIQQLLLPGWRDMLRRWYHRRRNNMTPEEIEFKDQLSRLAGEQL
jgi:glucose-6-phosphate dehydrogenase assembly protein OpcA